MWKTMIDSDGLDRQVVTEVDSNERMRGTADEPRSVLRSSSGVSSRNTNHASDVISSEVETVIHCLTFTNII